MTEWSLSTLLEIRKKMGTIVNVSHEKVTSPPISVPKLRPPTDTGLRTCSKCPEFTYVTPQEFRLHCQSESHLRTFSLPSTNGNDTDSSDSSSSSSDNESANDLPSNLPPALLFNSVPFKLESLGGMAIPKSVPSLSHLVSAQYIVVLLYRSGRFAGAVWDNSGKVIDHTSFKRYTDRRKNGGSQSKQDKSGSFAHSMGAQIRRAQETRLVEEVREVIEVRWRKYFGSEKCLVFAYASKLLRSGLVVGPLVALEKDARLCKVLTSVRRPSFTEVERIYGIMTSVATRAAT